ncbi:4Fe-4S binding protein [Deferribacter autotrophicus]|uniref:4Fe-4S binding protein n=1 Tax=Deferribacter autotrophicus TaxID=500465 RepID=A0A5A8F579_9BACT|nr:4Fe-4S binding protein [Deferribacter autotrophicus]KAA0257812.1 4Fe-4S binding protein [Deferribacter autotrophicus]
MKNKITKYRRLTQTFVFILMFLIPMLNIIGINFIKGTFYSLDVGDIAIADPLAIFQAFLVSKHFVLTMFVSIIIPVLLMFILGRIWCSWMCPYHFLVELLNSIRIKLRIKKKNKLKTYNKTNKVNIFRFSFLISGLFITGVVGIPLLNLISAPGIISSQALVLIKFHYFTFEIVFILILLIIEILLGNFFWCRYFCPTGTFLSIFRTKKGLHIVKTKESCSNCLRCIKSCPMGINPMTDGNNYLCHNCGKCVDVCPDNKKEDTLKFRFF